jgi:hypothetical protein
MKASLKRAWINALRSGEYTQGRKYLNAEGALCCLGVLCEVAGVPKNSRLYSRLVDYDNEYQVLPVSCPGFGEFR